MTLTAFWHLLAGAPARVLSTKTVDTAWALAPAAIGLDVMTAPSIASLWLCRNGQLR